MRDDVYWVVIGRGVDATTASRHWTRHRALEAAARLVRQGHDDVVVASREHVGGGQIIGRTFDAESGRELSCTFYGG